MSTMDISGEAIRQVLRKEQKLTADDLQILRKNTAGVAVMSGRSDYLVFRMEVELIDAIRALDEASAKLITTTNRLTAVILAVTVVGVVLAVIQIVLAVRSSH